METAQWPRREGRNRIGLLALLLAGAALISVTGATMSLALFTSTAVANNNAFTTGTVVIGINPANTIFSSGLMMPGDSVPALIPGQAVTVTNSGTATLRYAITGVATNAPLASQLVITIKQPDGNLGSSCALFNGTTLNNAGFTTVGTTTTNIVGDPTQGTQTGDRTLAGGASETLCFKVALPTSTSNTYQGTTTNITFTFNAEQTANNP
jgi:predicted ribosomally synthesized peptide with SipW-like signal peptide